MSCDSHFSSTFLDEVFVEWNEAYFEGQLPLCELVWNTRMRSTAGRFIPQAWLVDAPHRARIEIAGYLRSLPGGDGFVRGTLGHEMIHYWLWDLRLPYGHTPVFYQKMRQMGVPRFNPVPKVSKSPWVYVCPKCLKEYPAKRRSRRSLACARCCKQYARGFYDKAFELSLKP
jgi:predicted SprT family Zn-dependent metalloprotease